ncbi:5-formyltetrahydrofolate cyclo-ligase [Phenylobacterium montanum]|uniref:5-formyltetrahydrofolate cyclo-ligase n=1 Tax=Phenylobacterium montanum TaxID=2823693 RepID=A0A975FWB2_9CAUL|nr:5-formyltetrahydrofolate cyclo-ligase [Caulobacter sp. S6]QUD86585.1 5-formyltetrahydrofolate cyclo-ligase [Caulobacter sp. S6]
MIQADPASAKALLREEMRALRRGLRKDVPGAAEQAAANLPQSLLGRFAVVSGYHPLGGEIDPRPLMARLQAAGATLALPVTLDRDAPLIFRRYWPGEPVHPDAIGVPSPAPEAAEVRPDLVITPLVAFDRRGARMGQGGGFYDRTLAALRARGPVFALGLAYAGQEVARIPGEAHDQMLDAILTETGYIPARKDF